MYTYSTHSNHKVKWSFLYHSGKPFPINDYTLAVRIDTGRGSIMIKDEELVKGSNYIEIDLPAKKQVSGVYSLKATLFKGQTFTTEFRQPEAFLLSPLSADTSVNIDVVSYAEPLFSAKDEAEAAAEKVESYVGDNDIIPRYISTVVEEDGTTTFFTSIIRVTKAQYNAIEEKGEHTLYIVRDGSYDYLYLGDTPINLAGGSGPAPTPSTLENAFYFGNSTFAIEINDEVEASVKSLSNTKQKSVTVRIDRPYFYIVVYGTNTIAKVVSENNEVLTSDFLLKGTVSIDSKPYKLYEFHLSSGIALDASVTITVN